ncbi:MAG: monovalent cation:H+ antiporter-2, family [Chloroflexota bacterium]|jgi:CPA2 family monovalent cation:H+ antiporter-2|nr:monovalent cation:H+ antiporter-2, family [Chloroflexota bacterium]
MPTALPILEIGMVLLAAAGAGWLARRVGLPAVVGYLAVGLVVSPFTPGYVADRQHLELLADVGVVLLLFEVGIEIDLALVSRQHRGLLFAAPAQTIITTLAGGAVMMAAGFAPAVALTIGLAVALSSSVVIVNITRSRRRNTDRDTETALLGWSVLQDVTGVAIAAVLIALVDTAARPVEVALLSLGGFVVLSVVAAALLPQALRRLHGESDLFLIVCIAAGLSVAGLGAVVFGIPLALAAFVGGLTVTESGEAAEARRRLRPFRDVFAVLFFVAIGTLLDPNALGRGLGWVVLLIGLLIGGKTLVAYVLARVAKLSRPSQVAIGLSQVGEFSFVLATLLVAAGRIPEELHAALLAVVVLSIAISAVAARLPLAGWRPEAAPETA